MYLRELLKNCAVSGTYDPDIEVSGVTCDSRMVKKGDVFVALTGERTDGKAFIREALHRGAVCIVSEDFCESVGVPVVNTENIRSTCAVMFSNLYGAASDGMNVTAVTGTNGKTTASSLLWHIYTYSGRRAGLLGTVAKRTSDKKLDGEVCDDMTTPAPERLYKYIYEMKIQGCEHLILEASSHGLAQSRLDGIRVNTGIFMNMTPEHLDFHGSMENYYSAKRRLCEISDVFFANYDDPYGKRLCGEFPEIYAYSAVPETAADSRVWATGAMYRSRGLSGIEYMFCSKDAVFPVKCRMVGKIALYNSLAAISAALKDGISPDIIIKAVEAFKGVKGRFETVLSGNKAPACIIDYAHTPDSFEKALLQTRALMKSGSRLILVFGCGGERDRYKRSVMGHLAEKYADTVVVTEDNSRGEEPERIIREILGGMKAPEKAAVVMDRERALFTAVEKSSRRDVILILGKGHEEYIIDKYGKRPFSERKIIKSAILEKYGSLDEEDG